LKTELKLTAEQEKELEALQNDVKARLNKLLTEEQKKAIESFRPRRPEGPGGNETQPPNKGGGRKPNDKELNQPVKLPDAGIQWFATLESGLKEAKRTGRPILLVSGTPHCAGVSGIW
jgi:hypothetical protein